MSNNDETTVQHRLVQIKQLHSLASDDKDIIWKSLNDTSAAAIAISDACQTLVSAAVADRSIFKDTVSRFQLLARMCQMPLKRSLFAHAITQLLIHHANSPGLHIEPFRLSDDLPGTVHPFVTLLCARPELSHELLNELDFFLDCNPYHFFETMQSYFDAVFLLNIPVDSAPLLNRLTAMVYSTDNPHLQEAARQYLWVLLQRLPTQRDLPRHLAVMDVLINVALFKPDNKGTPHEKFVTGIIYQLLCQAYDSTTYDRPTLPYLRRLQRLYCHGTTASPAPEPHIAWVALSYLLITVQTVDDQMIILQLMNAVMHHVRGDILFIALVPLFQAQSEQPGLSKTSLADILAFIDMADTNPSQDTREIVAKIELEITLYPVTGMLSYMIPSLHQFLQGKDCTESDGPLTKTKASHLHALLFSVPRACSENADTRHAALSRIATISRQIRETCYSLPVLHLLLYVMRHPVSTQSTLVHIIRVVMPSLVNINDAITTSAVLRIAQSIIYGQAAGVQSIRETTMASLGVKFLYEVHGQHHRVWQELKKVLSGWILRRKSKTTRSSSTQGQIQMELSVLTTMRDLCLYRPKECAQDILPMVVSLLQSCLDLNLASLTILVDTICACVQAGLAEPRPIWTLAMSYIAQYADTLEPDSAWVLWERICNFFVFVGKMDEATEHYLKFKEDILNDYISRLMVSTCERIQSAALRALSAFPAADVMTLLPEKSKDYLATIGSSDHTNKNHAAVLVNLLTHELDHMQRGLFKGGRPAHNTNEDDLAETHPQKLTIGDTEERIGNHFMAAWENVSIGPALRKGYHVAILHAAKDYLGRDGPSDTVEAMTKSRWYRCMKSCLGDVGLTDHLLVRVSCIGAWTSFFATVMTGDQNQIELKSQYLLQDLETRLSKSTVPGTTCNILLCLTGMIMALFRVVPSCAASCASRLLTQLTADHGYSNTVSLRSEEAKFALRMCVGHIAECVITSDKDNARISTLLLTHAADNQDMSKEIDMDLDIVQFADGYAAGHFTAVLATWPTKTKAVETLARDGVAKLLATCKASNTSESRVLGIMMGWASRLRRPDMEEVYSFGLETLRRYTGQPETNKGRLFGAAWVCGYGALSQGGIDNSEAISCLRHAKGHSTENMAQHDYHFDVSLARLERLCLTSTEGTENEASKEYSDIMLREMEAIQTGEPSSATATTAVFTLGALLGSDYLNSQQEAESVGAEAIQYSKDARHIVLGVLTFAAGLDANDKINNPKMNRIAAVVCGSVIQAALTMRQVQQMDRAHTTGEQGGGMALLGSVAVSEPKSYSRLSNTTSYLRAVFDACVHLAEEHEQGTDVATLEDDALLYLTSLTDTPGPLPAVNWFNLLRQLSRFSTTVRRCCLVFASTHATTSQSLAEYVMATLGQGVSLLKSDTELAPLLVGEVGLGRMLDLSGLVSSEQTATSMRRGMGAVTSKAHISEMRVREIVGAYTQIFMTLTLPLQLVFLETLNRHLPKVQAPADKSATSDLVQSLRDMIMYQATFRLLGHRVPCPMTAEVIRQAVKASVGSVEQLMQDTTLQLWLTRDETLLAKLTALTEVYRLHRSQHTTRITETITHTLQLGVDDASLWQCLAETMVHTTYDEATRMDWLCRLLDILIVVGSGSEKEDGVQCGLALLRRFLGQLYCHAFYEHIPDDLANNDAALWLAYAVDHADGKLQEKMITRLFQLVNLVSLRESRTQRMNLHGFLFNVLRSCRSTHVESKTTWSTLIDLQPPTLDTSL